MQFNRKHHERQTESRLSACPITVDSKRFKMMKLLLMLLLAQLEITRCSSWDIVRGDHDMFRSEYIGNVSVNNMNCRDGVYCSCVGDYKTFVYNGTRKSAKCLKDENIITGQSEGKSYLRVQDGQCLGVSAGDEVIESTCNKDNLSYLWLWVGEGYLLNLRMLKCLQIIKTKGQKLLRINPCIDKTQEQRWKLGQLGVTFSFENIGPDKFAKRTFNCTESSKDRVCAQTPKYKGGYQFSDGQFLRLVKPNDCTPNKEGSCSVEFNISAPIFHRHKSRNIDECTLDLKGSKYSQDGYSWQEFQKIPQGIPQGISVDNQKTQTGIILKIENTHSVLGKFPGHLLKLEVVCNEEWDIYERHYVLLKIASSPLATIPTTKPTMKPSRSSSLVPTSEAVPVDINSESTQLSNTTVIIVSVFVSLFLLVAVVTVVVLYRRRKRVTVSIVLLIIIACVAVGFFVIYRRRQRGQPDIKANEEEMQSRETQNSQKHLSEDSSQTYEPLKENRRETGDEHLYQGLVGLDSQSKETSAYVNTDEKDTTNPGSDDEDSYENSQTYEPLKKDRRETADEHLYQGLVGLDSQSKDTSAYVNIDEKDTTNPGSDDEDNYEILPQSYAAPESTCSKN